ncbi:hypothetical protein SH661x_002008 [Planctomicrobium sp. SH661]|uniref:hypothetical protein n=1 Tax=Planctomicrobium sp. SH661 TaxID=3448124 RepID=UPI003F5AE935
MQKYRVACPHCDANLLVTEDLLGQPGNCPACHAEFLLPDEESFTVTAPPPASPAPINEPKALESVPPPPASVPGVPPSLPFPQPSPRREAPAKKVRIEGRPTLRMLSGLLKVMAAIQVIAGCLILVILLFTALKTPLTPQVAVITVGLALLIGGAAIPMLAFSELLLVFISQEEMLRHLVNEHRSRE